MRQFEPYHIHSCYSNALTAPDSTMFIKDYAKVYRERGHKVLCMSEHGNRSNVWEQFDICEAFKADKENPYEMTPLAAAECYFVPDRFAEIDGKKDGRNFHLVLVARDMEGFYELNEALSEANLTGFYGKARVDLDILGKLNYKHFLCTTACFVKGTKVKTLNGTKNIEDINSNDYIMNMYGNWERVNFPTQRIYNGIGKRIYIKDSERPIECTENHKFLTVNCGSLWYYSKSGKDPRKWVEAKDLDSNKTNTSKPILLEPFAEISYKAESKTIKKNEWKNKLIKRAYCSKNPINDEIVLTPEIMMLFGLWLGDGHISIKHETNYYAVGISFASKEFDFYWNNFVKEASDQIGIKWAINKRDNINKVEIQTHNIEFVELLYYLFGNSKCNTKLIPERILHVDKSLDLCLCYGLLLADGYFRTQEKDGYQYGTCVYRSINKKLTQQLKNIFDENLIRTGKIRESAELIDSKGTHHEKSYTLQINNNAFICFNKTSKFTSSDIIDLLKRAASECNNIVCEINGVKYRKHYISKIEDISLNTTVHCLNVNSHSFVCENVVVHNCVAGITKDENYEQLACQLHEIFRDSFYLEVQHHPQQIQVETNMKVLRLYQKYHWPLIYGTDSHYIRKEDKVLRTELLASAGITYGDEDSFDLYLPTADEAFQMLWDQGVLVKARIEEAMENTLIMREFEGVKFDRERKFPISRPELTQEQRNRLYKHMVCDGYIERAGMPTKEEAKEIHAEMDTIVETNSADYFIGLHDMLELGIKKGGVLTTTSRGSACGFASNFALGFTSINRLRVPVQMYPARFISKAKLLSGSMPDIDSNIANLPAFEEAGKEIFGQWGCLPMIAFGTVKTLSAFKLLARARDLDFETANIVSKEIQNYEMDVKHALENNADDPDYNVDDDVNIESYVDEQYIGLIEDSKRYKGIITSVAPHPCGHIVYHKDLRREMGVIRVKSKSGSKEPVYAAYIDGTTADKFGFCKSDLLRVDVVKIISDTFKKIGKPVMTADELVETTKGDKKVWDILAKGFTMGCNQTEKEKTTQRVMKFKPKNTVELSAFIAAIRPGAKTLVDFLVDRQPHTYGIPSMDKLLKLEGATGTTGESSFLFFDEQIMKLAGAAGIAPEDTNALIKHIKKKHHDEVIAYEEQFVPGFIKYLVEEEKVSVEKAEATAKDVFTVIRNSASYLFNLSHAYAMCLDCLYGMYLKAYYPYEFYVTLLKLYNEKKNKDKIAQIISEMKRYKGIKLIPGTFGQDNRDWFVDKENATISQSISSILYMNKEVAEDLYQLGQQEEAEIGVEIIPAKLSAEAKKKAAPIKKRLKELKKLYQDADKDNEWTDVLMSEEEKEDLEETKTKIAEEGVKLEAELKAINDDPASYETQTQEIIHTAKLDCFTNVLRAMQMGCRIKKNQIEILIGLNYFSKFGKTGKLMKIYQEYFEGTNSITKLHKSFEQRLETLRQFEASLPDEELPAGQRLQTEYENIGLCLSVDPTAPSNLYFVESVDDKYSIRAKLYSVQRGTTGIVRIAKKDYTAQPLQEGLCLKMLEYNMRQRNTFRNGQRIPIPGEKDCWVTRYTIVYRERPSVA